MRGTEGTIRRGGDAVRPEPAFVRWLQRFGPHGGARCIPCAEYLEARARGLQRVEQEFYRGILLPNGVYKTTSANRMDDLMSALVQMVGGASGQPIRILDVACSSGVSTVEMHEAFRSSGRVPETTGTDLLLFATCVRRADGVGMLFDHDGRLLQVEIGRWASPWRWRPRDMVLRPWRSARARRIVRDHLHEFRAAIQEKRQGFDVLRVPLLSSATDGVKGVRFVEEDILEPRVSGPFDLIRAANILNQDYFDDERIRHMASVLSGRLGPDGQMWVVRSAMSPRVNHASLFHLRSGRLEAVDHINGGVQIAGLLEGVAVEPAPATGQA